MCTRELTAYRNPSGGRPIFGYEGVKLGLQELKLPCGKCPECQKSYYTDWATRGSREILQWDDTIFVTLTYDDDHLPPGGSLAKKDVQDFVKRVKKFFRSSKENPIRQIYCGEYGTKTGRPHYHIILFNCQFKDRTLHRTADGGQRVYVSETLRRLWPFGNSEFGDAQPGSIAYLFKYILKKKTRKEKLKPLLKTDTLTGEVFEVEHEFIEGSRNPGIGAYMRGSNSIRKGYLTVDGVKKKLPKYYLEWLRKNEPETYDRISNLKFDFMSKLPVETAARKRQKEFAQKKLTDTKKRL